MAELTDVSDMPKENPTRKNTTMTNREILSKLTQVEIGRGGLLYPKRRADWYVLVERREQEDGSFLWRVKKSPGDYEIWNKTHKEWVLEFKYSSGNKLHNKQTRFKSLRKAINQAKLAYQHQIDLDNQARQERALRANALQEKNNTPS